MTPYLVVLLAGDSNYVELSSYPFIALARRYGANYGDVLSYADLCHGMHLAPDGRPSYWQTRATERLSDEAKYVIDKITGK